MQYNLLQFRNRKHLDLVIKTRIEEEDDVIFGTPEQLKKFHLVEGKKVYGVTAALTENKESVIERQIRKIENKQTVYQETNKRYPRGNNQSPGA
jgi:hypothetical protein